MLIRASFDNKMKVSFFTVFIWGYFLDKTAQSLGQGGSSISFLKICLYTSSANFHNCFHLCNLVYTIGIIATFWLIFIHMISSVMFFQSFVSGCCGGTLLCIILYSKCLLFLNEFPDRRVFAWKRRISPERNKHRLVFPRAPVLRPYLACSSSDRFLPMMANVCGRFCFTFSCTWGQTKSGTVSFQPVSERVHNKIEREWKRGSAEESVGELRTSMPAMSIRSLTLNFWPISLSLGTQYSTMLLNWITDMKTSTVGVKPKPQLGLLWRLFLIRIWRGSPDRGIGPAPSHFLPTSSWYVLPWWAHWLGSQCPPRLPVFREPPAICAFSPEGEKLCWISNFNFFLIS